MFTFNRDGPNNALVFIRPSGGTRDRARIFQDARIAHTYYIYMGSFLPLMRVFLYKSIIELRFGCAICAFIHKTRNVVVTTEKKGFPFFPKNLALGLALYPVGKVCGCI